MFAVILKVALFLMASPYRRPVSLLRQTPRPSPRPSPIAVVADTSNAVAAKPERRPIRARVAA